MRTQPISTMLKVIFANVVLHFGGVGFIGSCALAAEPASDAEVPSLRSVRTWGDLHDQKPIRLQSGGEVRLGVSATSGPIGNAILVYCLTRDALRPYSGTKGVSLGPLAVLVDPPNGREDAKTLRSKSTAPKFSKKPWLLYSVPVAIEQQGKRSTSLIASEGAILSTFTVEGTNDSIHAWTPLQIPAELQKLSHRRDDYDVAGRVAAGCGPAAIATCEGEFPIALLDERALKVGPKSSRSRSLPRIEPGAKGSKLAIRVEGSDVWIDFPREVDSFDATEKLLARWWINDKPVAPCDSKQEVSAIGLLRNIEPVRKVYVEMLFDVESLGAKRGDRIGLQLLYCREGWSPVRPAGLKVVESRRIFNSSPTSPLTMISNRVDWTVR